MCANTNTFMKIIQYLKKIRKRRVKWYRSDYKLFLQQAKENTDFLIKDNYPCVKDKFMQSGVSAWNYFYQDLSVAKEIYEANPLKHVDIGSRIDGFVAHVAVFREIEVFDIRSLDLKINNIIFKQADLVNDMSMYESYCDSISCLHTIEHIGLGRYGDKINFNGHKLAFNTITSILKKDGVFYFSVPMGNSRIEFNAHRVFSLQYLLNWLTESFSVTKFSYVDDNGHFFENIPLTDQLIDTNCGCFHGCAIFVLKKK